MFSLSLVYCEELESTDTIIVNITSTKFGSNATYQCRDGPTDDVYTTQCTSDGVWDPNPLSTLDCGEDSGIYTVAVYSQYYRFFLTAFIMSHHQFFRFSI